jgi:glycosyltransferase involved in cell wall biosynthesis
MKYWERKNNTKNDMKEKWYSKYATVYGKPYTSEYKQIAEEIKSKILKLQSDKPVVSVVMIAHNEGENLLSNLWSVSEMQCKYPVEIIGVDNDSTDNSVQVYRDCGLEPLLVTDHHTAGASRQAALEISRGKYYVCMDGDTMYPPKYIETMVDTLVADDKAVAACAKWDFLPREGVSRMGMKFYEILRNIHLNALSHKRPELAVRGMTLVLVTEYAKRFGFRRDIKSGEDGSLILRLKELGKVIFVHNKKTLVMTGWRTMSKDGTLNDALIHRLKRHLKNISYYFTSTNHYDDDSSNLNK